MKHHPNRPSMPGLFRLLVLFACCWCCAAFSSVAGWSAELPDIPPCEAITANASAPVSIGIVQAYAAPELVRYAVKLARQSPRVTVCGESWSALLPRFAPWAGHLERGYGFLFYFVAFLIVVALLSAFIPRQHWRRTTLIGVLSVAGLTWLAALILLFGFHALGGQRLAYGSVVSLRPARQATAEWFDVSGARELEALLAQRNLLPTSAPKPALAAVPAPASPKPGPQGRYHTFHRVNLREKPGVESPRLMVIPSGQEIIFDGALEGDWWRIKTESAQVGWLSSIWVRRLDEAVPE